MTNWTSEVFKEILQHFLPIFYFLSKSKTWEVRISGKKLNAYITILKQSLNPTVTPIVHLLPVCELLDVSSSFQLTLPFRMFHRSLRCDIRWGELYRSALCRNSYYKCCMRNSVTKKWKGVKALFHMGNRRIWWHAYVTEQVIKSVSQIKRMNNL